jgi:hypothetical protein
LKDVPVRSGVQSVGGTVKPVGATPLGTNAMQDGTKEIQEIEEPKVPMFRRIRNLVPQRKSPAK